MSRQVLSARRVLSLMQRKLTVILSADVVGYSGLMEIDEAGTLERLKTNRARIFDPHLTIHGGRLFKLIGDGALVEFPSVSAAVLCALAIQEATERADTELADAKRIHYRIGINLGEVIVEGDDIYGEGVNVAARLQTLAPAGGVAVARIVKDQVEGKAACVFEDMGEHTVKNIERPVQVFSVRSAGKAAPQVQDAREARGGRRQSICVLPFNNMSGDAEQEYFSDGISEDIITDLSKVSALSVVSRNSAFMYKGKNVDLPKVVRELNVSHVLEGSVRKSGGRVRITAQLINGATNDHVWAERYDRDLSDIFALQDEISEAIVKALKLKLLPEEKKAIERRGTDSVDAYDLYLLARQHYLSGNRGDARNFETIVRLCRQATEIDPGYARAWALMALAQTILRFSHDRQDVDSWAAVERALALDPNLAEAHAIKAEHLRREGRQDDALREVEIALRLDPESHEVNGAAGAWYFGTRRFVEAARYYEKAAALAESDFSVTGMLISCYTALGEGEKTRRAAQMTLTRAEAVLALDRSNTTAMGMGASALAMLGERERAKDWVRRALLIDPDNILMRYNFSCALSAQLNDVDGALDVLSPWAAKVTRSMLEHAKIDPDLDPLRQDPRFKALLAAAEARLAAE
jgi:adenylate cyclase